MPLTRDRAAGATAAGSALPPWRYWLAGLVLGLIVGAAVADHLVTRAARPEVGEAVVLRVADKQYTCLDQATPGFIRPTGWCGRFLLTPGLVSSPSQLIDRRWHMIKIDDWVTEGNDVVIIDRPAS